MFCTVIKNEGDVTIYQQIVRASNPRRFDGQTFLAEFELARHQIHSEVDGLSVCVMKIRLFNR